MPPFPDRCRREDCAQPRTRLSVFCEAHHTEALKNFFTGPVPPREPFEEFAGSVRATLFHLDRKIITFDQALSGIFDDFVYCHASRGFENFWTAGFDLLTDSFAANLLANCKSHPEPRVFLRSGVTTPDEQRAEEQAALAAQAQLISILEDRCGNP